MKDKYGVTRLLQIQLLISVVISVLLLALWGTKEAVSAMLGGLVVVIPSAIFARKLF